MCGIVGYTGTRDCRDLLLSGLERLEYRGYDSAGLSLVTNGSIDSVHAVGNLAHLRGAVAQRNGTLHGVTGIGHTRWATHGRVTTANAHPHWDTSERVHIVLNGIVENWTELKRRLVADGAQFTSDTDAEVVAHLIASHLDGDLTEAVRLAYNELRGHYAFVAMSADHPRCSSARARSARSSSGAATARTSSPRRSPRSWRRPATSSSSRTARSWRSAPRARASSTPTAARSSARSTRSTGTRTPPRRAATRPSCSRRSTSRPTRWPRPSPTGCAARRGARRHRDHRRGAARGQAGRGRGLRHVVPRGAHRPLRDRGVGAGAGRDGHRLRVPLPQPGAGRGRPRDRDHPVRRDRRHARGDAPGPRDAARRCWRSPTSWAARPRATRTACCSRARASRSASRPRRPSSLRWPPCTCWR